MEPYALINTSARVKESNTQLVLSAIKKAGTATRNEIARSTGLSLSTCSNILKNLMLSGEITEGGLQSCNGGRPAKQYIYNKSHRMIGALIVSPEQNHYNVQYIISNLYKEIITQNAFPSEVITFAKLEALLTTICTQFSQLTAISIVLPAQILRLLQTESSCFSSAAFEKKFSQKYNLIIKFEKMDAILAMEYYRKHTDSNYRSIASISISSSGVSAGYVLNGQIHRGDFVQENLFKLFSSKMCESDNSSRDPVIQEAIFAIAASLATLHPDVILLSEPESSALSLAKIQERCKHVFPLESQSEFILQETPMQACASGALDVAINSIQPHLSLVMN